MNRAGLPCKFTVVTATYNRAATLHRVYDSLRAQTIRDFEWLVVDDGSTDNTRELVSGWTRASEFPIRYLAQDNQGKHIAFNRAVREARGGMIVVLDSDDSCVPEALARFQFHWEAIPPNERDRYTGVTALCADQHGRIVGDPFPRDGFDSDALELRYRHRVRGEKWGCNRADVLRRFPFPEDVRGTYVPESIVWNRIAREFRTRYVNEKLRVYWIEGPSLVHGRAPARNAFGGRLENQAALNLELDWFGFARRRFLRSAMNYARFSFHLDCGIATQWRDLSRLGARVLWLMMLLPGLALYSMDRCRRAS